MASGVAASPATGSAARAIEVDPAQRGRGLGDCACWPSCSSGAPSGARPRWLHVEADNAGAFALYDGLGFVPHHTYRYLIGGLAAGSGVRMEA